MANHSISPKHSIAEQLSRPLLAISAAAFVAGIVVGLGDYLNRSSVHERYSAGTAAWWPHLGLFVAAVVWFAVARIRNHRRRPGQLLMLSIVGRSAGLRLRRTLRAAGHPGVLLRVVVALLPAGMVLYGFYRSGIQVLGGLDPNFTVNAWGGPSYIGAMACHYLDGALLMAASAVLLNWLLLRGPAAEAAADPGVQSWSHAGAGRPPQTVDQHR
jgi:hypothetical protein